MKIIIGCPASTVCAGLYFITLPMGLFMVYLLGAEIREDWLKILCLFLLPAMVISLILERTTLSLKKKFLKRNDL